VKRNFDEQGYAVARGLFTVDEADSLSDHFMRLRAAGACPGDVVGVDASSTDPLATYPRMIHMHRWDDVARAWLLDPRLAQMLAALLDGREPYAVQTMLYFKPPGRPWPGSSSGSALSAT
jgi:phytanoyl-CoA hydroxylase